MRRLAVALSLLSLVGGPVPAQDPTDIRNPTINSESEQGALITQAGMAEEAAEKIQLLETFAGKYSDHSAMGYVYLQLQGLYLPQNNFDKVIDYGKKLIAIVPADVEVRHNLTKATRASKTGTLSCRTSSRPSPTPRKIPRLRSPNTKTRSRRGRPRSTMPRESSSTSNIPFTRPC